MTYTILMSRTNRGFFIQFKPGSRRDSLDSFKSGAGSFSVRGKYMKIKNTNSAYGNSGPFEADSFEDLADSMTHNFTQWANESFDNNDDNCPEVTREKYVPVKIQVMRDDFIEGLEEIK